MGEGFCGHGVLGNTRSRRLRDWAPPLPPFCSSFCEAHRPGAFRGSHDTRTVGNGRKPLLLPRDSPAVRTRAQACCLRALSSNASSGLSRHDDCHPFKRPRHRFLARFGSSRSILPNNLETGRRGRRVSPTKPSGLPRILEKRSRPACSTHRASPSSTRKSTFRFPFSPLGAELTVSTRLCFLRSDDRFSSDSSCSLLLRGNGSLIASAFSGRQAFPLLQRGPPSGLSRTDLQIYVRRGIPPRLPRRWGAESSGQAPPASRALR